MLNLICIILSITAITLTQTTIKNIALSKKKKETGEDEILRFFTQLKWIQNILIDQNFSEVFL